MSVPSAGYGEDSDTHTHTHTHKYTHLETTLARVHAAEQLAVREVTLGVLAGLHLAVNDATVRAVAVDVVDLGHEGGITGVGASGESGERASV